MGKNLEDHEITYAGFSVGGETGRPIEAFTRHFLGYQVAGVSFTFVVSDPDQDTFLSLCAAAKAAFRKPRQDFLLTINGDTDLSFSHGGNTGFDSDPKITKEGQFGDSPLSRFYQVEIQFGLPADNVGTGGRRNSDITLAFDINRKRTLTISGVYTATPGASAQTNYDDGIETYCTAKLSEHGITFSNLTREIVTPNETNKILQFTRVYTQIIYSEAGAALDDPEIQEQRLVVTLIQEAPGDSPEANVTRLATANCSYDLELNADLTTDLDGKWDEVKEWVERQAATVLEGGYAVTRREVSFNRDKNSLSARFTLVGATGGAVVALEVLVEDNLNDAPSLKPVVNGNKWARMRYQGFPTLIRTRTETTTVVVGAEAGEGAPAVAPLADDDEAVAAGPTFIRLAPDGGKWARTSKRCTEKISDKGRNLGGGLLLADRTTITTWEYYQEFEVADADSNPESSDIA